MQFREYWAPDDAASGSGEAIPPPPEPEAATAPPPYVAVERFKKSPALATLLAIFPGVGHVYVGYYSVGFRNVIVFAAVVTMLSNTRLMSGLEPLLGIFLAFFYFYQMLDAGRRANLYNRIIASGGKADDQLPELPDTRPGPVFGVLIMVIGFFLLLETQFGFSLHWLRDWWPMLLIASGGYITWKNIQERNISRR